MGLFKNALIFSAKKGFPALEACWGEAYAPVLAMKPVIMQKLKWFVREVYKPPLTLCHGDVHMDNIFFDEAFPTGLKIIDFGNFCVAQPGFDAYFLGQSTSCSLPQDARGGGRDDYSLEDCWRSYRLNLFRVLMNVMFVTYDQFVKDAKRKRGMFADLRLTRTASSAPPTTPPTGGWPPRSSTQSSTSCLRPRARRSTIPAGASPASAPSSREAAAGSAPTLLRRSGTAAGRAPRSDASHLSSSLECNVTSGRDLPTSSEHDTPARVRCGASYAHSLLLLNISSLLYRGLSPSHSRLRERTHTNRELSL